MSPVLEGSKYHSQAKTILKMLNRIEFDLFKSNTIIGSKRQSTPSVLNRLTIYNDFSNTLTPTVDRISNNSSEIKGIINRRKKSSIFG